jgi:hypothetical protein
MVGTPDQRIKPPGGSGIGPTPCLVVHLLVQCTSYIPEICQKPEDIEFPTNSTAKNCTIFWETVLLPKMRASLQEIQKDRQIDDRQIDIQIDRQIDRQINQYACGLSTGLSSLVMGLYGTGTVIWYIRVRCGRDT